MAKAWRKNNQVSRREGALMALVSAAIIGYAVYLNDPYVLTFLAFPALIAWINWKDI